VALEAVIQASLAAQAQADTLAQAVQRSSLQICEFMPLVADCLLSMLQGLGRADRLLQAQVEGLRADAEAMQAGLEAAPTLVTALLPQMGYEAAGRLAAEFAASGRKDVRVFLQERLGAEAVAASLSPAALTRLGYAQ
jgi:aspartate ammonia-lyase